MRFYRPPLPLVLAAAYFVVTWYSFRQSSLPSRPCGGDGENCLRPLVSVGDNMTMKLFVYVHRDADSPVKRWKPVESCLLNFSVPATSFLPTDVTDSEQNCTLRLPEVSRRRWSDQDSTKGEPLQAMLRIRQVKHGNIGSVVAEVPLQLTTIDTTKTVSFWQSDSSANRARKLLDQDGSEGLSRDKRAKYIPYLRYGSQPVLLRFVADTSSYGGPPPIFRSDGTKMFGVSWNRSAFRPIVYVDDNALQDSLFQEIAAPPEGMNKPPVMLRIQYSSISPMRDVFNQQLTMALSTAESLLQGVELDEFRYWLRDERLYRFFLTQVIAFVHVWLDYLAFRDEVRFYKGKSDTVGVSVSTIVARLVCSIVIFLYLMDGGGTSWIVLLSVFSGIAVESWKVWKVLGPTRISTFPYMKLHETQSREEDETAQYDRIAITHMMLFLLPLLVGWSFYALQNYAYTSWYSWFISNLANGVYTFGFITLCPQLYVNFRLKSVAHLPWKVFLYKIFNTFVDDVFAFLIDMPWKHRMMTLRDDVVFVMFLVQAWMYRVDKSRTNEYGYSYDNHEERTDSSKEKIQ